MKHKGLSWDGGKKRTVAAFVLAAVMVLPGVAQARTVPSPTTTTTAVVAEAEATKTLPGRNFRGVSWS
jgi:hypothetical protein